MSTIKLNNMSKEKTLLKIIEETGNCFHLRINNIIECSDCPMKNYKFGDGCDSDSGEDTLRKAQRAYNKIRQGKLERIIK